MAIETFGPLNDSASEFITEIGRRTSMITEEKREISFLRQRISMALQRFNAVCFRGSFTDVDDAVDVEERNPYIPDSSTTVSVESCSFCDLHPRGLVDTVNDVNDFIFNNPMEILQRTPYPSEDLLSITK